MTRNLLRTPVTLVLRSLFFFMARFHAISGVNEWKLCVKLQIYYNIFSGKYRSFRIIELFQQIVISSADL